MWIGDFVCGCFCKVIGCDIVDVVVGGLDGVYFDVG